VLQRRAFASPGRSGCGRQSDPTLRRGWQGGPTGDLGAGGNFRRLSGRDARQSGFVSCRCDIFATSLVSTREQMHIPASSATAQEERTGHGRRCDTAPYAIPPAGAFQLDKGLALTHGCPPERSRSPAMPAAALAAAPGGPLTAGATAAGTDSGDGVGWTCAYGGGGGCRRRPAASRAAGSLLRG